MRNLALVLLLLNIVFLTWQLLLLPEPNTEKTKLVTTKTTINNHPMPSSDTPMRHE